MSRIKKITHPYPSEIIQARIDESIVTGQPLVERPFWYEHTETGQLFYDLYGCIGWPTEVSDKDEGMPGYVGVMGVVKPKKEGIPVQDAAFQLLTEGESLDVPTLLDMIITMREEYGFGQHPTLLQSFWGDPERFITTIALKNERLVASGGERLAILVSPPLEFYETVAFDEYVRALQSVIIPGRVRFYFGGCDLLKNKLREFKRNNPAVMAVGGLVHTLLAQCEWMDQARDNAFVVEEVNHVV